MKPDVVVVGSVNMDMVAHARQLPAPGETLQGHAFATAPGGKGGNQAVAAARLGARVAMLARVGLREHGPALLHALAQEGVQTQAIVQDPLTTPGVALIMVASQGGENAIVYVPGSNADLCAQDVQQAADLLRQAKVVVAQLEVPQAAIERAFELARAAGVITLLNAAPAGSLSPALLARTDWLVLNETEAGALSGLHDPAAAAPSLLALGPSHLVVTLGAGGLLWAHGPQLQHMPAPLVDAVDTVGAGDTFVGGLATGLAQGLSPKQALQLGQAAAAVAVSRAGVQSAMPTRAELNLA